MQAPVYPIRPEERSAAAEIFTLPPANAALQVPPQLMPAGLLVTVPVPVPAFVIVSVDVGSVGSAITTVIGVEVTSGVCEDRFVRASALIR
jgi:hypothetical protein